MIISDGVFGLPNAAMVHALLAQLRSHTVCCSFVKVGSPFQAQCRYVALCSLCIVCMYILNRICAKQPLWNLTYVCSQIFHGFRYMMCVFSFDYHTM